ncbi:hypothetical protein L596_016150 [Steinernema carpocapsae]|uniref:Uncharacterized protein n=1 Tax=Steinernema carpocapsae TaxID=34508 RepID=A0A4U5NIC5_STECR|nr:hypothetical protein L596_016150 [Steinernema carpocapsae]
MAGKLVVSLCLMLAALLKGALAQPAPLPGYDPAALADNVKKFSEVYGLATQIMNMGGKFLGGSGGSGGSGSAGLTSSAANYNHNGILGEVVRPQFRGVGGNEYGGYGENSLFENRPSPSFSEYGGGPLGGSGRPAQRQSAIASLMNTFLGSSLGGGSSSSSLGSGYEPLTSSSSSGGGGLFGSALSGYGAAPSAPSPSSSGSGSDINEILAQLMRSGAKPAQPEPAGPASFISQLFGVGR